MAEKPSILEAQTLPFMSLFRSCMISYSRMYGMVAGVLLAIIAVVAFFLQFGGAIWRAINTVFWAVIGFLHLGQVIAFIGATVVLIWNTAVATANGAYALTQRLLPGVLEFTITACREVTNSVEGKDVKSKLCDGTTSTHFPASGVYGAIVAAEWLLVLIGVVWVVARIICWWKATHWKGDDWKEFTSFMFTWAIPCVMATIFLVHLFTGVTYMLTAPILKQVFALAVDRPDAFYESLVLMLVIFAAPIAGLQYLMTTHVKRARLEAKRQHDQMPVYTYDLNESA